MDTMQLVDDKKSASLYSEEGINETILCDEEVVERFGLSQNFARL